MAVRLGADSNRQFVKKKVAPRSMADIAYSQIGPESSETHDCPEMVIRLGSRGNGRFAKKDQWLILEWQILLARKSDPNALELSPDMAISLGPRSDSRFVDTSAVCPSMVDIAFSQIGPKFLEAQNRKGQSPGASLRQSI